MLLHQPSSEAELTDQDQAGTAGSQHGTAHQAQALLTRHRLTLPRCRRGQGRGTVAVVLAAMTLVAMMGPVACGGTETHQASGPPPSPKGPLACDLPGNPPNGSGRWTLVLPATVCGMKTDNSAAMQQANPGALGSLEFLINAADLNGYVGHYTRGVARGWQLSIPGDPPLNRGITFNGLDGTFKPAAVVSAVGNGGGYTVSSVPAGPHGGVMACGEYGGADQVQCVWATTTTLGCFILSDTTGELTGSDLAANAVRIRDVLEQAA
jgi:hypothetical protein